MIKNLFNFIFDRTVSESVTDVYCISESEWIPTPSVKQKCCTKYDS